MNKNLKKILLISLIIIGLIGLIILGNMFLGKNSPEEVIEAGCDSDKLKNKFAQMIDDMNHCESKNDCVLLNGCPFGCNNLINKNADMDEFVELQGLYRDDCGECQSSCVGALRPEEIECRDKKCISTKK